MTLQQLKRSSENWKLQLPDFFRSKIIDKRLISITSQENELLRKYLFLLSFRSESRKNQYKNGNFDSFTRDLLLKFTKNGDFLDLWLRELDMIIGAKDNKSIRDNPEISDIIKMDYDLHLKSYYMTFVNTRGQDIVMSDIYSITPSLVLLLNHISFKNEVKIIDHFFSQFPKKSFIKEELTEPPKAKYKVPNQLSKNDTYTYKVKNTYESNVIFLNSLILNEAINGFIFTNKERIVKSIGKYESSTVNKKVSYKELIDEF